MNKTSVDMIKELSKVVDHGIKSQAKLPPMPKNDDKTFEARIRKAHCAFSSFCVRYVATHTPFQK